MKQSIVLFLFVFFALNFVRAQVKYEKEYRLPAEQVPQLALDVVNAIDFDRTIKWYKEEGFDKTSIEAKTKFQQKKYSIEFDNTGQLEDVEIEIKQQTLPSNVQNEISSYLKEQFQKHKICKIQVQYLGQTTAIINAINQQEFKLANITTNYELVVKVKQNNIYQEMEFLFDAKGQFLQQAIIIDQNTDNLEY